MTNLYINLLINNIKKKLFIPRYICYFLEIYINYISYINNIDSYFLLAYNINIL